MRQKCAFSIGLLVADAGAGCARKPDDAALVTNIKSQMFSDAQLKDSSLQVTSKNGEVTLAGSVSNDAARYEAYKIATQTARRKQSERPDDGANGAKCALRHAEAARQPQRPPPPAPVADDAVTPPKEKKREKEKEKKRVEIAQNFTPPPPAPDNSIRRRRISLCRRCAGAATRGECQPRHHLRRHHRRLPNRSR